MSRAGASILTIVLAQQLVTTVPLLATETDFDARWKQAEANVETGPGQKYFSEVFFHEFFAKYTVHVNECTKTTGELMNSELKALVELGADGTVLAVDVRPGSAPARCFGKLVERDTFSKPPTDHFLMPVVVGFTKP